MPRSKRIAKGNIVYHVLNRANGRLKILKKPGIGHLYQGDTKWVQKTAKALSLESSLHPTGRPKKEKQK